MPYINRYFLFLFLLFCHMPAALCATAQQIETARIQGIKWLLEQQRGSGSWTSNLGDEIATTSAVLDALSNAGVNRYPYAKGLSWLSNAEAHSTDMLARQIITLFYSGIRTDSLVARLMEMRSDPTQNWGAYTNFVGSHPDTALALDTIRATGTVYSDINNSLAFIVSTQNSDGGWPYMPSSVATPQSHIIATAYNLLTLIGYRNDGASVQVSITNGINWLLSQQNTNGSFGIDGSGSVLETALAYLAIVTERSRTDSAAVTAQDFLIAQQSINGSWDNKPFQSAMALQTLPATVLADTDKDGIPDPVEVVLGTDPNVADSRYLASGNGEGEAGITTPLDLAAATLNQAFSITLQNSGGTGPFTWTLVSGSLPNGLSLNQANGQISGLPTTTGSFTFTYTVTDVDGTSTPVVARIEILGPQVAVYGDLNNDSQVTMLDVLLAQRILNGELIPTAEQLAHGNVAPLINGAPEPDDEFNIADWLLIQRKAMGLIDF